jgi:FixJ family two-component response regulator
MLADPILLVDDEADLRAPLRCSLQNDGYSVDEAEDTASALAMIERRHYAVIITDLHMPNGPSGLDLIAAVKSKDPDALCVVITGYASLDVSIRAMKCGAYDFLQKPFKLMELEAVLDRALEHARVVAQFKSYQDNLETMVLERTKELRTFHQEVLRLNGLLLDAQGQLEERPLLEPFLHFLQGRFSLDAYAFYVPGEEGAWLKVLASGRRPWFPESELPRVHELQEFREWAWPGGYPDGYLVPFQRQEQCLGLVYLGFEERSAFHPKDPSFLFWRLQVEAALHGLRCARNYAVFEAAKALGWE